MKKSDLSKEDIFLLENCHIPCGIFQYTNNKVITLVLSAGFIELFDLKDREEAYDIMDNDMYRFCHPEDVAEVEEATAKFTLHDTPYSIFYRHKVRDHYEVIHAIGKHFYMNEQKLAIIWYADEGKYDPSLEFKNEQIIQNLVNIFIQKDKLRIYQFDYLTGLPTVAHFFNLIETFYIKNTIAYNETPTVLFLDLNGTKYFNAKYGFAEGDKLIKSFARLLTSTFGNDCCCRFGLDRFCVYTTEENIETRLWNFFDACENINDGKSLPVRVGIYTYKDKNTEFSLACDCAKMACDSIKGLYVSRFVYFDNLMFEQAEKEKYILEHIDEAIEKEWIQVYYQPIVRAANGRVCDEEALSRWIDPEKGFLNPEDFISVLEDAKVIYKLDLFVTEKILKKMKKQADNGLYVVPVSVNLSRSDFESCDIVQEIYNRTKAANIEPEKLTIEITESIIGKDYDYMKSQIKRFQSLGYKVWMDDFGSGYSSLEILHDFQFDLIKFDMKFMQEFNKSEKSKILLSGLMRTAINLGIDTICEGVENKKQVDFLKEIGCTKLQGFYYCKPIPLIEVFERYEKGIQIGFENPQESDYYATLGKLNLYDLSAVTCNYDNIPDNIFNSFPMAIVEFENNTFKIVRGNSSYRKFIVEHFSYSPEKGEADFENKIDENAKLFKEAIAACKKKEDPLIIDEKFTDGCTVHLYLRQIAKNPITNVTAIVLVVLGIDKS
ncbi:MAG: GGDEF and EAL domain-containing protein [Treponema sp.]|nr:GGDEF and EAL domain-containing protein [Treponema sp.]